jgi:hypothetical protein
MDLGESDLKTYWNDKIIRLTGERKIIEMESLTAGILNAVVEMHSGKHKFTLFPFI